ncbi:uncharacterized protein [Nicotiana tomentosiformis]|uniref:uncharacterized protein n=1 Tax=Nicotiana tomentosiformis TaxID=4098 RepID=UPI00388C633B
MVCTAVANLPTQLARGRGQAGRGHPSGGGQAHSYAFPGRTEVVASDAVIIGIVLVCHTDASVLFDLGSTYSYVSSYFASYLDMSSNSLDTPIYVSSPIGDSLVADSVYRSCLGDIGGYETRVDLLLLNMVNFDVILGMN